MTDFMSIFFLMRESEEDHHKHYIITAFDHSCFEKRRLSERNKKIFSNFTRRVFLLYCVRFMLLSHYKFLESESSTVKTTCNIICDFNAITLASCSQQHHFSFTITSKINQHVRHAYCCFRSYKDLLTKFQVCIENLILSVKLHLQ